MRAYCCQFDIAWENKPANLAAAAAMIREAAPPAGSLVLLPEMFATGFTMNAAAAAEPPGGPVESRLGDLAAELAVFITAGVVAPDPSGKARNQAVTFGPDGRPLARYTKIHPFTYGGEHEHYVAGDEVALWSWHSLTVSPFICYDLRFPEAFRAATARGASVLTVIACWPAARHAHWRALLRARAIENQAWVVAANRCGADPKVAYAGGSMVVDPRGEILAEAGNRPGVAAAEIDPVEAQEYRDEFPALRDRRDDLGSRYPAVSAR